MTREHYAWRSLRRTGRQVGLVAVVTGLGFVAVVILILILIARGGE